MAVSALDLINFPENAGLFRVDIHVSFQKSTGKSKITLHVEKFEILNLGAYSPMQEYLQKTLRWVQSDHR